MGRFRFDLVGGCRRVRLGMDWNTAKANTAEAKDRAEPRPEAWRRKDRGSHASRDFKPSLFAGGRRRRGRLPTMNLGNHNFRSRLQQLHRIQCRRKLYYTIPIVPMLHPTLRRPIRRTAWYTLVPVARYQFPLLLSASRHRNATLLRPKPRTLPSYRISKLRRKSAKAD